MHRDDHLVAGPGADLVVAARAPVRLDRLVRLDVSDLDLVFVVHRAITVPAMSELLIDRSGGVVTVTINRPEKKNAITRSMWRRLRDVFLEIGDSADDRVMVLAGAGDAFSSGADLTDPDAMADGGRGSALASMRMVGNAAMALHECPKPTIAAVNGVAAGAGLNLALGCDLIIAGEEARFSEIFVKRGLNLDFGGTWLLPRLVGLHRAKELAFLGELVSAEQAAHIGLVNRVVPDVELKAEVAELAARLAALPPINLSIMKKALNAAAHMSMSQALEFEAVAQNVSFTSADTMEAMLAFVQKRPPNFRGE